VCGFRFTDVADEDEIQLAWMTYLGLPPNNAGFSIQPSQAADTTPKKKWPYQLMSTLGSLGVDILTSFFTYKPLLRLTAVGALGHAFLHETEFPLMCVEYADMPEHCGERHGQGRKPDPFFTPDVELNVEGRCGISWGEGRIQGPSQSIFPGKRHMWGIRKCVLSSDTVGWVERDPALQPGTAENAMLVQLVTASDDELSKKSRCRRVIIDRKVRIGGHLGTSSGSSMITLDTTQPCPVGRVIDLMTAFKDANIAWLRSTGLKAKMATRRLAPNRQGQNGKAFLKQTIDEWFLSACELTFTDAFDEDSGYLTEDHHNDGSMSVFHGGLTLGGRREMHVDVPGYGRMVVCNQPGTFYFGNLSGPPHQVFHKPCTQQELLYVPGVGYKTVTVMMRTGLHAHGKSRGTNHPTNAPAFRKVIERVFVEALQDPVVRVPTFEEVLRAHDDRVGRGVGASMVTAGIGAGKDGYGRHYAHIALARDGKKRRRIQKPAPSSTPLMR